VVFVCARFAFAATENKTQKTNLFTKNKRCRQTSAAGGRRRYIDSSSSFFSFKRAPRAQLFNRRPPQRGRINKHNVQQQRPGA